MDDADYEISIKTKADLKAAQDLKRSLEEQIKSAKALGQDTGKLEKQLASVDKRMAGFGNQTKQASTAMGRFKEAGGGVKGAIASLTGASTAAIASLTALAAAFTAAAAAALKSVMAFAKQEETVVALDAALAQQGLLSEEYRKRLQGLAGEMQNLTGVADDQWLRVLTRLTQMGSTPESIGMDLDTVKNLAGLLNGDVIQAARLWSRAIQGNTEGFQRLGIVIDQSLPLHERINKLQEEIALRGGGQLENRLKSLTGQWGQMKNVVGDFVEAIGQVIAATGIFQSAVRGITTVFGFWAEVLGSTVDKLDGVTNAQNRSAESTEEATRRTEEYTRRLEEMQRQADAAARSHTDLAARIRDVARAELEREDVRLAEELQAIDARLARGEITPAQATLARGNATAASAARQQSIERDRDSALVQIERARIEQTAAEVAELQARIEEERAAMERAEAAAGAQSRFSRAQEQFNEFAPRVVTTGGLLRNLAPPVEMAERLQTLQLRAARQGEEALAAQRARSGDTRSPEAVRASLEFLQEQERARSQALESLRQNSSIPELTRNISLRDELGPRRIDLIRQGAAISAQGQDGASPDVTPAVNGLAQNGNATNSNVQSLITLTRNQQRTIQQQAGQIAELHATAERLENIIRYSR